MSCYRDIRAGLDWSQIGPEIIKILLADTELLLALEQQNIPRRTAAAKVAEIEQLTLERDELRRKLIEKELCINEL